MANQFTLTSSRIFSSGTSEVPLPNELNSSLYARSPIGESLMPETYWVFGTPGPHTLPCRP